MAVTQSGVESSAITVSSTATLLVQNQVRRKLITFTNNGAVTVFIGGDAVTSSAFLYALPAGEWVQFTSEDGDPAPQMQWYGITASSTASVSIGEVIG